MTQPAELYLNYVGNMLTLETELGHKTQAFICDLTERSPHPKALLIALRPGYQGRLLAQIQWCIHG